MNLNLDFHGWRGFSTGSDLFDHQVVAGFVTVIADKRSMPAWIKTLLARDVARKAALDELRRRVKRTRDNLSDPE